MRVKKFQEFSQTDLSTSTQNSKESQKELVLETVLTSARVPLKTKNKKQSVFINKNEIDNDVLKRNSCFNPMLFDLLSKNNL